MEFLYPKNNKFTHTLKSGSATSLKYPNNASFSNQSYFNISRDTKVALIRDNIGYQCLWSIVKILDGQYQGQEFYALTSGLVSETNKISYTPICNLENSIDETTPEIDPITKETFVPYIDKRNGFYSVRIQTDYDKVLESFVFDNLLREVFYEGVSILLASRGFRADNAYIDSLINKFNCFAFINNDLDLTVNRFCEPITFTVSMPLNFFNEQEVVVNKQEIGTATKILKLDNRSFVSNISKLLNIISSLQEEVQKLLYPNNFIENFVIDFELSLIRKFSTEFSDFASLQGFSINNINATNSYELGFDDELNIVYIKLKNIAEEKVLSQPELAYFRLKPDLNSKRIFNYLLNLDDMYSTVLATEIKEFIDKYVNYPKARIVKDTIFVNGKPLDSDKAEQFKRDYASSTEECINLSDVTSIGRSITNIVSYADPLYHIFIKKDIDNIVDYNTYSSFAKDGKKTEKELEGYKEKLKSLNGKPANIKEAEEANKNKLLSKADSDINAAKAKSAASQRQLSATREELTDTKKQISDLEAAKNSEEYKNKSEEEKEKDSKALSDLYNKKFDQERSFDSLNADFKSKTNTVKELEKQKDTIQNTAAETLATPEQQLAKIDLKKEFEEALQASRPVNFGYSNSVGEIQYDESSDVNLSTLLYLLNRINITEILFKKLLCSLKGTSAEDPIIADILSQLPVEVINYFNYLNTVSKLKGTDYILALEKGVVPDLQIYCASNNGLIYFVKGLRKLLGALDKTASFALNATAVFGSPPKTNVHPYEIFIKNLVQNAIRVLTSLLLDLVKELLQTSCEDPIADLNSNNFSDPFNTHYPAGGFGGSSENNNNPNTVKKNRSDILEKNYFQELQFGFDREYTVDLIGRLINDINCILTPIESVQLLQGVPTEVAITLIKNIIRAKYSVAPNDLSFLLTDENKLKLFFKELGLTVDPEYLTTVTETITNYLEPSSLCDDQTLKARKELNEGKVPKELGNLDRQQQKRVKTAKVLFDRIKNGETTIEISPLCPDLTNDEVEGAKDNILNQYVSFARSSFSNILTDFTQEAKQLPQNFSEKKVAFRIEGSKVFDSVEYYLYNSELGINLSGSKVEFYNVDKDWTPELVKYYRKFTPKTLSTNLKDLSRVLVGRSAEKPNPLFCPEKDFTFDPTFENFLNKNLILVEFAGATGDFQFDDRGEGSGDLAEYYDGSGRSKLPDAEYIKSKDYIYTISLNYDPDPLGILDYDEVSFKLIYNDTDNKQLRILSARDYEGEIDGAAFISDNVLDSIDLVTDNSEDELYEADENYETSDNGYTFSKKIDQKALEGKVIRLNSEDDIYVLTKQSFEKITDNRVKQLLQSIYITQFQQEVQKIENFKKIKATLELFNKLGLFQDETNIDVRNQEIVKKINITVGNSTDSSGAPKFTTKEFASWYTPAIIKEKLNTLNFDLNASNDALLYSYNPDYYRTEFKYDYFDAKIKTGEWKFFDTTEIEEKFKDRQFDVFYDPSKDTYIEKYSQYAVLDYPQDDRYRKCNIYPHYLNLEYLLQNAEAVKKADLCSLANYNVNDIMKILLVELTYRVYITDLLTKAIPYLSTMSKEDLLGLYNRDTIVNILKEMMKRELLIFSPDYATDDKDNGIYYKYLSKITKEVYEKYKSTPSTSNTTKINNKFVSVSLDEEVDYFIKKEIYRFIKYCLEKGAFTPASKSYFIHAEQNYKNYKSNTSLGNFFVNYWIFEYESALAYHIMANTVDSTKRSIFYSTKSELANKFFSLISSLTTVDAQDANVGQTTQRNQEDIIKFIQNLGASPNPAAMAILKPEYAKYVKKYLLFALQSVRSTLATLAENTDANIALTRRANYVSAFISTTAFSLLDEKTKVEAILFDGTLTTKRISDGKAPLPDLIISLLVGRTGVWPLIAGWSYLAADTVTEAIYYYNASKEVEQLASSAVQEKGDPCKITEEDKKDAANSITCSPENKKMLTKEINSMEDP